MQQRCIGSELLGLQPYLLRSNVSELRQTATRRHKSKPKPLIFAEAPVSAVHDF